MTDALRPRAAVQKMAAYAPPTGHREGKLRLDFNENTVGCWPAVAEFLRTTISESELAVYPEYESAKKELAAHFAVQEGEMLLTNGTDEAIQVVTNTYVDEGDEVIILEPSYAMYRFYAELAGAKIRPLSYQAGTLAFPKGELLATVSANTRVILLSNPNNPTGTAVDLETIERILQSAPGAAVLIDEAYFEFFGVTALPLLARYPNLIVSRTFSKAYGMAAMRVGCLFSDARNIAAMGKAQSPYSVNMLAARAARVAINQHEDVSRYVTEVLSARAWFSRELDRLRIPFHPSSANFLLLRLGEHAEEMCAHLKEAGILVRNRSHELPGCVRVTIGTHEQMRFVVEKLEQLWT